jgi:cytosine deaminase
MDDVAQAIASSGAVVFSAGAGPGSGSERKETMDYGGAVKLIAAAKQAGIRRYLIVSSMGANPDAPGDDTFSVYLRAKGRADDAVRASGLDWTVVRPGGLTNDAGRGRVTLGESVPRGRVNATSRRARSTRPTRPARPWNWSAAIRRSRTPSRRSVGGSACDRPR